MEDARIAGGGEWAKRLGSNFLFLCRRRLTREDHTLTTGAARINPGLQLPHGGTSAASSQLADTLTESESLGFLSSVLPQLLLPASPNAASPPRVLDHLPPKAENSRSPLRFRRGRLQAAQLPPGYIAKEPVKSKNATEEVKLCHRLDGQMKQRGDTQLVVHQLQQKRRLCWKQFPTKLSELDGHGNWIRTWTAAIPAV